MAASFIREKQPGRLRLLCCLVLAALMLTQWIGAGHSEAGVQALNSSGNLNRKPSVDPNRRSQGYSAVLYDNRNGLPTSEANAIAQTSEGFLWIGSYAGLIRYDGTTFERLDSTAGIANVRCLYVDSQDRLWIGTNDSGLFMMAKGELRNWNRKTGLPSVSVRAVAQDGKGVFYIAGTAGIAMLDSEMNLPVLRDERIADQIIWDIRAGVDGLIYGLFNGSFLDK